MVVGVVTATIAAAATVTAAIITTSGGTPSSTAKLGQPSVHRETSVAVVQTTVGTGNPERISVDGTASSLPNGDVIYAIAAPRKAGRWFVSQAALPDMSGRWQARIDVAPPQAVSVQAVWMAGVGDCNSCSPPPDDPNLAALQKRGPGVAAGSSGPVRVPAR